MKSIGFLRRKLLYHTCFFFCLSLSPTKNLASPVVFSVRRSRTITSHSTGQRNGGSLLQTTLSRDASKPICLSTNWLSPTLSVSLFSFSFFSLSGVHFIIYFLTFTYPLSLLYYFSTPSSNLYVSLGYCPLTFVHSAFFLIAFYSHKLYTYFCMIDSWICVHNELLHT